MIYEPPLLELVFERQRPAVEDAHAPCPFEGVRDGCVGRDGRQQDRLLLVSGAVSSAPCEWC